MGSLRSDIQALLQQFLQEHENEETAVDMLAMVQQEASLLQETTLVHDAIRTDNFECLMDDDGLKNRLMKLMRVTDCHRVHTKDGYSHYTATVQVTADAPMKGQGVASSVSLRFEYERHHHHHNNHNQQQMKSDNDDDNMLVENTVNADDEAEEPEPPSVVYYIDLARDHGPSERMLWVQVFPAGLSPSNKPAMNMSNMMMDDAEGEGGDDDEWEDMSDDDDDETSKKKPPSLGKRIREGTIEQPTRSRSNVEMRNVQDTTTQEKKTDENEDDDDDDLTSIPDRYVAGIDPDVMARFLHWTQISLEDELAAFYFLMTFPFYEHEFHLIDYLLEAVFGPPDGDENSSSHEGGEENDDDSL